MAPSPDVIDHNPRDFWSVKNHPLSGITSYQWARLLWRHGIDIDVFVYWPRLLFLTCISMLNTVGALCDTLIYGNAIKSQQLNDEPVFILGHPRTGTTHLHNLLSKDERFAFATTFSVGFPSSFLSMRLIAPVIGLIMDNKRPMDNMALAWDTPQEDELATNMMSSGVSPYMPLLFPRKEKSFRKFYRFRTGTGEKKYNESMSDAHDYPDDSDDNCDSESLREWQSSFIHFLKKTQYAAERGGTRKRLLLKSPVHTARVKLLKEMFPKATFIFAHRHPLKVFQSAVHMADAYYWQCYLQLPTRQDVQEFILYQGELLHRAYEEDIKSVDDDKKTMVRFEDLDADLMGNVERMYLDLGWGTYFDGVKPALEKYQLSLADFKKNAFGKELSGDTEAVVRERWRSWFEDLGYE